MGLSSFSSTFPSIENLLDQERTDLVAAALGRIQATDNRFVALQIGLREIVYLTGAGRGTLVTRSQNGDGLQPLVVCHDKSKHFFDFLEPDISPDKATVNDPAVVIGPNSALFSVIPLKSFGNIVGAIHLDQINYSGPLAAQRRVAVETLVRHLALIVESRELAQVAQDRQTLLELLMTAKQVGQRLNASFDAVQPLAEFLESSRFLFNAEKCFILTATEDIEKLRLLNVDQPDLSDINLPEVSLSDTMIGWVVQTGESLLRPEIGLDQPYVRGLEAVLGFEIKQLMAVPLNVRGEVLGVVAIVNKNSDHFDELDLSLLQMLAPSAAIALENAHRFAWQQAEAAQKTELYSVASHALRSPMMNILTSVEWMLEAGVRNKKQRTRLEDIRSQIFNLAKFAGAILDMSRIETENLRTQLMPVALTPLIKKIVTTFERRFPDHHFELVTADYLPPVFADEAQLSIILDHLIENAVKYSPVDSVVRVKLIASDDQVSVAICDRGSGILPDELEEIFDRYYRGRHQPAKEHSLGLGLYIVRKLVQAQGGEIWVESNIGQGSCFTFSLLRAELGDS